VAAESVTLLSLDSSAVVFEQVLSVELDSARFVITDPAEWRTYWKKLTKWMTPSPSVPELNFDQHSLLVAAGGDQLHHGDGVDVEAIAVLKNVLLAVVVTTRRCGPFPEHSSPLQIVMVPAVHGRVTFLEKQEGAISCMPFTPAP